MREWFTRRRKRYTWRKSDSLREERDTHEGRVIHKKKKEIHMNRREIHKEKKEKHMNGGEIHITCNVVEEQVLD